MPENTPAEAPAAPVTQDATDAAAIAQILGTEQPPPVAQAAATDVPVQPSVEGDQQIDLTALTLQGVPQSVLELIPKPALQEWAAQAKEREAKRSTDFQRRSEEAKQAKGEAERLRNELGQFAKKGDGATTGAERKPAASDVDFDALFKPIADKLRSEGVDVGEQLAAAIKTAQLAQRSQVEGLQTVNDQLTSDVVDFFVDDARSKLAAQIPQLSDDQVFDEKVRPEFDAEIQSPRYRNMSTRKAIAAALERATKNVLYDDLVKAHVDRVVSNDRKRMNGQPTVPARQPQKAPPTAAELDDAIARELQAGNREAAARLARG